MNGLEYPRNQCLACHKEFAHNEGRSLTEDLTEEEICEECWESMSFFQRALLSILAREVLLRTRARDEVEELIDIMNKSLSMGPMGFADIRRSSN